MLLSGDPRPPNFNVICVSAPVRDYVSGTLKCGGHAVIDKIVLVEETQNQDKRIWWLVVHLSQPTKVSNFKAWIERRTSDFDLAKLEFLTPMLQRRFGWGDVRNTPEFLKELQTMRSVPTTWWKSSFQETCRSLARQELVLRNQTPYEKNTHLSPVAKRIWLPTPLSHMRGCKHIKNM